MNAPFDLTIRNGIICTETGLVSLDIGVAQGKIAALGKNLTGGIQDIDASDKLVLPGGIDSHCHIEQMSGMGIMGADDFYSATMSAAFGGTTTVIPFAAQRKGESLVQVVESYAKRALPKAVIDYGFHIIVSDPSETVLKEELPLMIKQGITSFKVYMTYESVKLDDFQLLDVFDAARKEGGLVMVHAENNDIIRWMTRKLLEKGHTAPKYHAVAHDPLAESEATYRAISLAKLAEAPILLVHVGGIEAVHVIHSAQLFGAPIYAETCPQYLFLTKESLDLEGLEGAKFCCAPPPRDPASQAAVWAGIIDGTLSIFSSDHAPYRLDATGKLPKGNDTVFSEIANGLPGLETRLPLLFSEGVNKGKISVEKFVEITSTNHAKTYGLYPRKGVLKVGSDADIAIWDTAKTVEISSGMLHDNVGYTPYEGMVVQGWPIVVISQGNVVIKDNRLVAKPGDGRFLARSPSHFAEHNRPPPDADSGHGTASRSFKRVF